MKPAKSSANRCCRSATTKRSRPRSGGGLGDAARTILRLEPRRLAQRLVDALLPAGTALAEMRHHVAIEPDRDQLLGGRPLWPAPPPICGDDLRRSFDRGAHPAPHLLGHWGIVRVAERPGPDLGVLLVGHRCKLAQRLASCLRPTVICSF